MSEDLSAGGVLTQVQCPSCRVIVPVKTGKIRRWTMTGVADVARQVAAQSCPHHAPVRIGDGEGLRRELAELRKCKGEGQ